MFEDAIYATRMQRQDWPRAGPVAPSEADERKLGRSRVVSSSPRFELRMETPNNYHYASFRAALRTLVANTVRHVPTQLYSIRSGFIPQWESDSSWNWIPVQQIDTQLLVGYLVEQWRDPKTTWPEFRTLLNTVQSERDLTYALLTDVLGGSLEEQDHLHWLANYIRNFMFDYFDSIELSQLQAVDDETFARLYLATEWSIHNRIRRVAHWAPIYNFAAEPEILEQLSDMIVIREPDRLTMAKLSGPLIHDPSALAIRFPRYFMHLIEDLPLKGASEASAMRDGFQRSIAAIRLEVAGDARVNEVFFYPEPGYARTLTQGSGSGAGFGEGAWATIMGGYESRVTALDVDGILNLWQRIPTLEKGFPVPLRRYLLTTERREYEDRLIDASIGLEGLLLADRQTESAVLFGLRGAWLLGQSDDDRAAWSAKLTKVYNLRSRVVHANAKALAKLSLGEVRTSTDDAVEALRLVLRHLAHDQLTPSQWDRIVKSAPLGTVPPLPRLDVR